VAQTELNTSHRVLLVDDDDAVRDMMEQVLVRKGFGVVAASSVPEALKYIASENFDVLLTDLHMPAAGDGFTVVSAMRHSQPDALTLLVSGFPDVQSAMSAIVLEADEILTKPFEVRMLPELIQNKLAHRKPGNRPAKESVGEILQRCTVEIVADWLTRAKRSCELNHLQLSDEERKGFLTRLVQDLVIRLRKPSATTKDSDAIPSEAAVAHGKLRCQQGYTAPMLVHESRILQVTLFGTLQANLNSIDFSLLLPDVMAIADEVDAQLTQSMESFMNVAKLTAA
jgi:DNA-binding response OmpR family regulator